MQLRPIVMMRIKTGFRSKARIELEAEPTSLFQGLYADKKIPAHYRRGIKEKKTLVVTTL
jgi:hypothetical protein